MTDSGERFRWFFTFTVGGDLRFISHHDTLRLLRRALARADLPVRFSEGFNPHPRMSIPLPRPVGIASDAEAFIVEFETQVTREDVLRRLREQMPHDMTILEARPLSQGEQPQPEWVRYRLSLDEIPVNDLDDRIERILAGDVVNIERSRHGEAKSLRINIRPYIMDLQRQPDNVEFTLRTSGQGTAKPSEIAGLLGFDEGSINHRIRRVEVRWK